MQWERRPTRPLRFPNPAMDSDDVAWTAAEIARLLDQGVVGRWRSRRPPLLTSPIFVVHQRGKRRLVFNYKAGNRRQPPPPHFRLEGMSTAAQLARPGDWMCKLDIEGAYHGVPLHPSTWRLMAFSFQGEVFFWKAIPFGWSWAPLIFTKIMRPVVTELRSRGVRLSSYLDDFLFLASSLEEMRRVEVMVRSLFLSLGLLIKEGKTTFSSPTRNLEFLGLLISTDPSLPSPTVSVPSSKRQPLAATARRLLSRSLVHKRDLARFLGSTAATISAFLPARFATFHLHRLLSSRPEWDSLLLLNQQCKDELNFWKETFASPTFSHSRPLLPPSTPTHTLTTDASAWGWGATLHTSIPFSIPRVDLQEPWGPVPSTLHNNILETKAILTALRRLLSSNTLPPNSSLLIRSDNTVALAALVNICSRRSPTINRLAASISSLLTQHSIRLCRPVHLPGVLNTRADRLSRGWLGRRAHMEYPLRPEWVSSLSQLLLPSSPTIDLFATPNNSVAPRFFSLLPHPSSAGVDAMNQRWSAEAVAWCNPPFSMMGRVVRKLTEDRPAATLVIAPNWPAQPWFHQLTQLATRPPIPIPSSAIMARTETPASAMPEVLRNPSWGLIAFRI